MDAIFEDRHVLSVGETAPARLAPLAAAGESLRQERADHFLRNLRFASDWRDFPLRWWVARDMVAPAPWTLVDAALLSAFHDDRALPVARLVGEALGILSTEAHNVDDGIV